MIIKIRKINAGNVRDQYHILALLAKNKHNSTLETVKNCHRRVKNANLD